ncbi:hypothetical protein BDW74DRAFT_141383 [Aspergillus multicolor]|uniref:fungal specific transcription factor domain-containing protein n=1 Tax=Aspergillus multicolor TaxID=41759 RepID=UPI003CCD880D
MHGMGHIDQFRMAYHNCQILIHRPFILTCQCAHSNSDSGSFSATASQICKSHALEIMHLVRIYHAHYSLRYSAFVLIHYLLNACTVLVVNARIYEPYTSAEHDHRHEHATLSEALQSCVAALREISHAWAQASKALQIVHHLMHNCDCRCRRCKRLAQHDGAGAGLDQTPGPAAPAAPADPHQAGGQSTSTWSSPPTAWVNTDFNLVLPPFCEDISQFASMFDEVDT